MLLSYFLWVGMLLLINCSSTLQHRTVQRKGQASGARCAGEAKTRSQEEKDGGHAREAIKPICPLSFLVRLLSRLYIYKREK